MTIFYLVRHAHSDWSPDENRPLSEQDSRDAIRVVDTLSDYYIDSIYSSPATHVCQTISPFGRIEMKRLWQDDDELGTPP